MTQPSEPRTKEGRALLASLASGEYRLTPEQEADYTNAILAIEAEAAAPDPVASPPEAVRLLRLLADAYLTDAAHIERYHRIAAEARRYLAATEEGS